MALTDDQIRNVVIALNNAGAFKMADDKSVSVFTPEDLVEFYSKSDAHAKKVMEVIEKINKGEFKNIPNIEAYRNELLVSTVNHIKEIDERRRILEEVLPGFDSEVATGQKEALLREDERKRVIESVLPQFDEDIVKERADAKQQKKEQESLKALKPNKVKLQERAQGAQSKISSAETQIDAARAKKKALKAQLAELNSELREGYLSWFAGKFETASVEVNKFLRSAGLGASNNMAAIYATCGQAGANFMYYAHEFKKLSERSYEDGVVKLNKMAQNLAKDALEAFDGFKVFLHEAKKTLDPFRSYHHLLKEFKELRVENSEQRKALTEFVQGNAENAKKVLTEREVEAQEKAAQAELAAKKKEYEDFLAKLGEIQKDKHKQFERGEQDLKDAKKPQGVYNEAYETAVKTLRGMNVTPGESKNATPMVKQPSKGKELL